MKRTISFAIQDLILAAALFGLSGYFCWYMHRTQTELNRVENFLQHVMASGGQPQ